MKKQFYSFRSSTADLFKMGLIKDNKSTYYLKEEVGWVIDLPLVKIGPEIERKLVEYFSKARNASFTIEKGVVRVHVDYSKKHWD